MTLRQLGTRALSPLVSAHGNPSDRALAACVAGKVVLVTGASHGIGEATARRLAAAGAHVILVARSAPRLAAIAAEIAARGGTAHAHPCDLEDMAAVEALGRDILAKHGHVDVVVNNAGKSIRRSIALSYDRFHDFDRTMRVNYLGPVRLFLALLPSMRARGRGHIVNVSTVGTRLPPAPRWAAYQASKTAFDVWLRSVAPEIRADGVTTSSIYMALVHTRMSAPTPIFRHVPGLDPDAAAGIVCRAIVERPAVIAPPWLAPAALASLLPRRALEAVLGLGHRATMDTSSAAGIAREGVPGAALAARTVRALARARLFAPVRPDRLVRMIAAARTSGASPATACALAAARHPDQIAIVDERGATTYGDLQRRVSALAGALHAQHGIGPDRGLAIMCRNHRGFVEALLAASRLGADVLLLNTEFPGPQLGEALAGHTVGAAVFDGELVAAFDGARYDGPRIVAWGEGAMTLDSIVARGAEPPKRPARRGRIVILTSGTTGRPKGAPRTPTLRALVGPLTTLLSTIPLRAREPLFVAPPLFHGFGLSYLGLALFLGSTLVLRRTFDAEATLEAIAKHRVRSIVVVPSMLKRILDLPEATRRAHDTSSLGAAISAGAPLGGGLALAFMDAFGDVVFNLYGSSETGFGAIATPADLRAAPGTVGRPPLGTTLRVLDARGAIAPHGRVFIGGPLVFEGYSGGGSKEIVSGLMCTGDVGHMDAEGRLFIDGRADDMIVSGGENVFPLEVEEILARHDAVGDVAVIGVPDDDFGQRLRAFVVPRPGARPTADELKAHVKSHLARYKVPRDFVFVGELPRTATGKVVRARLVIDDGARVRL
jgi:acyl-CoA synthetase (AMP-forming)/AMP-acid ligase II/NAD(P)-dependent dehydrogenase (short-subunit alcohol dehydrogenase family)